MQLTRKRFYKKKILSETHKKRIGESVRKWHKEIGFSEETREKISKIQRGHTLSKKGKMKISKANKGRPAWNKGLTKTDPRVLKNIQKAAQTIKKLYEEGKMKPWNLGKSWSEEVKRKISTRRKGKKYEEIMSPETAIKFKKRLFELGRMKEGKNNPMYGRKGDRNPHFGKPAQHGKYSFREDFGHNCRSKWEANYIRFLLWTGRTYKYEYKTFIIELPSGVKATYTPDFLVDGKEWHELKGWEERLKVKKWELFQQQYPQEKFVFIDRSKYKRIEKLHKYIIPKWEF